MRITSRAISPDGGLQTIDESAALAGWRDGENSFWIDLESHDKEAITAWVANLGVDHEVMDAIKATDSTGWLVPLENMIYFEYPVPALDESAAPGLFSCLCLERLIVTIHRDPVLGERQENLIKRLQLSEPTISGLVCAMAVTQSTRLRRNALSLRDLARKMSAVMDDDPEAVSLEEILALKRRLLDMDRMADEQMAVFDLLQAVDKPELNLVRLADSFHLVLGNATATARRLERLDRAVASLQHRYESVQQDRTNRRLGLLTILSAIFMPLTLIAGIYGMNFSVMPELQFQYAYPIALGSMVVVAGALYLYFRSRGWLE